MTWIALAVAGGIGAVLRDRAAWLLRARPQGHLAATATVNLVGAFALGVVVAAGSPTAGRVLGTGLLGGLTTFSTWLVQAEHAPRATAVLVVVGQLVLGIALAAAGLAIVAG